MGRTGSQLMTLAMIIGGLVFFIWFMKNPQEKQMLTQFMQQITSGLSGLGGGGHQRVTPPVVTPPVTSPAQTGFEPTPPAEQLVGANPFRGRSTGPGTRSQDPVTQAINRCVGVGVNPPDPQAYNDCVNAAYPKKAKLSRIVIA